MTTTDNFAPYAEVKHRIDHLRVLYRLYDVRIVVQYVPDSAREKLKRHWACILPINGDKHQRCSKRWFRTFDDLETYAHEKASEYA